MPKYNLLIYSYITKSDFVFSLCFRVFVAFYLKYFCHEGTKTLRFTKKKL